jgi:hypothetical protein
MAGSIADILIMTSFALLVHLAFGNDAKRRQEAGKYCVCSIFIQHSIADTCGHGDLKNDQE